MPPRRQQVSALSTPGARERQHDSVNYKLRKERDAATKLRGSSTGCVFYAAMRYERHAHNAAPR